MRITVPLVVEIPDELLAQYAANWGLPVTNPGDRPRAKDVVEHARSWVLACVRHGAISEHADISIKDR